MKLIIGIDTGGTYTDAVLYDSESQTVIAKAKSLTTKEDLSIGIYNSFSKLPLDLVRKAELLSLSSTLATNACVEGKGGKAKLILFGMSRDKALNYGSDLGKYSPDDLICIETNTSFNGTIKNIPDWNDFAEIIQTACNNCDSVAVVEIYARQTGAILEKKAREIIKDTLNIETVCGYELFDDLNYLKRGASALLNAQLIPLIREFIQAVQHVMDKYKLNIPVFMVRSDGSVMSVDYAKHHPIETLLSGPVASTIGACHLAKLKDAVIVDMGGTTSDIAVLRDGKPLMVNGGITIGSWDTFVKGLDINTFGLGGDSGIKYSQGKLFLDSRRMIPLCTLASKYPSVLSKLRLISSEPKNSQHIHEFLVLQNIPDSSKDYTPQEIKLINALKNGPLSLSEAAEELNINIHNLHLEKLENQNIIMRSGLTPTDIMHIYGDYSQFSKEASQYAADFVAKNIEVTRNALCSMVYDMVCEKLYLNLSLIFMRRRYSIPSDDINFTSTAEKLIHSEWHNIKINNELLPSLTLSVPLIFIGGPVHMFADKVASAFHINAVIPENSEVANAIGAAVAQGDFEIKVIIRPYYHKRINVKYYDVYAKGISKRFSPLEYNEAVTFAKETAKDLIMTEAKTRGFSKTDNINLQMSEKYFSETTLLNETTVLASLKGNMYF